MRNPLKRITTLAKEIKKKFPGKHERWTDYVKEASKLIKTKEGRKELKKGIEKTTDRADELVSKAIVKHYLGKKMKRKSKPKKKASSYHKDTKSHNVRINVVSGIKNFKDYKVYKNHIIDIQGTGKNKTFIAHGLFIKIPFYTNSLSIAKKFIDRAVQINKK